MKNVQTRKSWILYDWANSVYSLVITTALFPIYFKAAARKPGYLVQLQQHIGDMQTRSQHF